MKALWCIGAILALVVALLAALFMTAPKHPVALVQVVDVAGKPIQGAVIRPDGLRTKSGPYASGHYGWVTGSNGVPNDPVTTDSRGRAEIPYPKFVFERIESGQISFSVNHPDFVSDRPFRTVSSSLPAGAPWRERLVYWWGRIRRKAFVTTTDPVVLQQGAILKLTVQDDSKGGAQRRIFAQASKIWSADTNTWLRPEPDLIMTRRLPAGTQAVRVIQFDAKGAAWFSDVVTFMAVQGKTNEFSLPVKPGVVLRGRLDDSVPRPVTNGRVVANVRPTGHNIQNHPPEWHAWSSVRSDGTFEIGSLPEGELEIVALCDGFVSTNGPGQFNTRYPQRHSVGTNDLAITIGMEATARLEVQVTGPSGEPVREATVSTWPNVRYGEWSSVIFASDRYNTADFFLSNNIAHQSWREPVRDFNATTDAAGLAVVPNVPATVRQFSVGHPNLVLPAVVTQGGDKHRHATVALTPGQTNRVSVRLEPRDRSPIAHY